MSTSTVFRHLACVAFTTWAALATGAVPSLYLSRSVDLLELMNRPLEQNTLKLFRAAVDGDSQRVVVSGIMSRHAAVLDSSADEWVATVDTGIDGNALKYLALDSRHQILYVRDATHGTLRAVNMVDGSIAGPVSVPSAVGAMMPDEASGELILVVGQAPSLRILDGSTLELRRESNAMGLGASGTVSDRESGELLVLDGMRRGPEGLIYRFDPSAMTVVETISFALSAGVRARGLHWADPGRSLVTTVGGVEIRTLDLTGRTLQSSTIPVDLALQELVADPIRGRIVAITVERARGDLVTGVQSHLLAYNADTLSLDGQLSFGRKLHSAALDDSSGRLYLPNGDASMLWVVEPSFDTVTGLRLGDSLEQVVPGLNGRTVMMNSRLGGSYLMAFDLPTGSLETFTAGAWPIPIRATADGEHLLVLNAWDGTVSVFDTGVDRRPLATVELGLPPGSTDRLPDLAVDSSRRLAYAAYPEHGAVAAMSWSSMTAGAVAAVDGVPVGDTGGGPGQLRLAVDELTGHVYAIAESGVITILAGGNDLARIGQLRVDRGAVAADGISAVIVDQDRRRLFAGRVEIDLDHGAPTGRKIRAGLRVIGIDDRRSLYWAAGTDADETRVEVVAIDRSSLEVVAVFDVGAVSGPAPDVAYDPDLDQIFVGWMTTAVLDIYQVGARVRRPGQRLEP